MLITPEKENSPTTQRVMNLPDVLATHQEMDLVDNSSHCCDSDVQEAGQNEMETSCVTGLSRLRLAEPNINSSPPQRQKLSSKFGPFNNLITSKDKSSPRFVKRALFLHDDDDNEVFNPPSPVPNSSPTRSSSLPLASDAEKQEVIAGRLYIVRQIGNASQSSASPSSPSRSFTKPFTFSSIGLSSPTSSPQSPQSPIAKRKLPVYVRVYKCHMDHFALISRDSSYSSRYIYLNMRHCRVMPGNPIGRFIIAGNSDSGSLMEFETPDLASLEGWLDALQTQTPPESPIRPGNCNNNWGGNSGKTSSSSCSSPSLPKSPGLPTLTEAEEEDR